LDVKRTGRARLEGLVLAAAASLRWVKLVHTIIWAFFAGCILAIPVLAWQELFFPAALLISAVMVEVFVLLANGWSCPLTGVAARYTEDRQDNFDIYLPVWLARYNKQIFGWLFVAGLLLTLVRWLT
jgi:hypothetical protein